MGHDNAMTGVRPKSARSLEVVAARLPYYATTVKGTFRCCTIVFGVAFLAIRADAW